MRIVELHVQNFKRLKAVNIRPGDNNVIEISGRNAQGKSSAIDAIWAALQGSAALKKTPVPVRVGAEKAEVRLDLGNYVVTRNWTASGKSYLTVTTGGEPRAKVSSPQKLLDSLVGDLCFDPLAFTRLSDKEQTDLVLSLLNVDLSELDRQRDEAYQERTVRNREISQVKAELESFEIPGPGLPDKPIDLEDLLEKHEAALVQAMQIDQYAAQAEALRKELSQALDVLRRAQENVDRLEVELDDVESLAQISGRRPDVDAIKREIDEAIETNRELEAKRELNELGGRLCWLHEQVDGLTATIDAAHKAKQDAIAAAQMPVKGLSLDLKTGLMMLGDVPLKQASHSEQLRVAVAMAMAQHPELRVMRVEDASLLDAESVGILKRLAADNDYQLWLEVVDDSGEVGVYIEDGEVCASNLPNAPDASILPTKPIDPPVTEEELL